MQQSIRLESVKKISNIHIRYGCLTPDNIAGMLARDRNTLFIGADGYNNTIRKTLSCDTILQIISCGHSHL